MPLGHRRLYQGRVDMGLLCAGHGVCVCRCGNLHERESADSPTSKSLCVCLYLRKTTGCRREKEDLEMKEMHSSPNSLRFPAAGAQASLSSVQRLSLPPPACRGHRAVALHLGPIQRAFGMLWGSIQGTGPICVYLCIASLFCQCSELPGRWTRLGTRQARVFSLNLGRGGVEWWQIDSMTPLHLV